MLNLKTMYNYSKGA